MRLKLLSSLSVSTSIDNYKKICICMLASNVQVRPSFLCYPTEVDILNSIRTRRLISIRSEKVNWKQFLIHIFSQIMTEYSQLQRIIRIDNKRFSPSLFVYLEVDTLLHSTVTSFGNWIRYEMEEQKLYRLRDRILKILWRYGSSLTISLNIRFPTDQGEEEKYTKRETPSG